MRVNDAKLLPLQPCALREGDCVQVGVPQDPGDPAYTWTFHTRLQVNRKTAKRQSKPAGVVANKKPCPSGWTPTRDLERKLEEEEARRKEEEGRRREQMQEQEERLEEMRRRLEEKDVVHAAMEVELRGKEEALREEMRRQKVGTGVVHRFAACLALKLDRL